MIPVCFHQRRYLLTACSRASTWGMGCLFSSSVLCLCIDFSSIHLYPAPSSAILWWILFLPALQCLISSTYLYLCAFFWLLILFLFLFWPLYCFSQCSVSCGGGVQTRSIQCLRQGRPAAGCLPYQRPITSRACNTQFCPAAAPAQSPGRVRAVGPTLKGKFREFLFMIEITPVLLQDWHF